MHFHLVDFDSGWLAACPMIGAFPLKYKRFDIMNAPNFLEYPFQAQRHPTNPDCRAIMAQDFG